MGYINTDTITYSYSSPLGMSEIEQENHLNSNIEWLINAGFEIDTVTIRSTSTEHKIFIRGIKCKN